MGVDAVFALLGDPLSCDPNIGNRPIIAHHDGREERVPDIGGAGVPLCDGGGGGKVEYDDVGHCSSA